MKAIDSILYHRLKLRSLKRKVNPKVVLKRQAAYWLVHRLRFLDGKTTSLTPQEEKTTLRTVIPTKTRAKTSLLR